MIHLYKLLILLDNKLFNGGDEIRIKKVSTALIKYFRAPENHINKGYLAIFTITNNYKLCYNIIHNGGFIGGFVCQKKNVHLQLNL